MVHMLSNISYEKGIGEIKNKKKYHSHSHKARNETFNFFIFFFFSNKKEHE